MQRGVSSATMAARSAHSATRYARVMAGQQASESVARCQGFMEVAGAMMPRLNDPPQRRLDREHWRLRSSLSGGMTMLLRTVADVSVSGSGGHDREGVYLDLMDCL